MKSKYSLTATELEIMEVLWSLEEEKSSKELLDFFNEDRGKGWKKQTLNTFLSRLIDKGLVKTNSVERKYLYSAAMDRKGYDNCVAIEFLNTRYEGAIVNFVSAMAGNQSITGEEAQRLRKLLEE